MIDGERQQYEVQLDGRTVRSAIGFAEKVASLERIHFRTGPYRYDVRAYILDGEHGNPGLYQEDLPGADSKTNPSVYFLDDLVTTALF